MITNLAADIERLAGGEKIIACAIGSEYHDEHPAPAVDGRVLTWPEARPLLDWEYDAGSWDGPKAWPIYAWTESWVIFTHDYDTSTSMYRIPRNPIAKVGGAVGAN